MHMIRHRTTDTASDRNSKSLWWVLWNECNLPSLALLFFWFAYNRNVQIYDLKRAISKSTVKKQSTKYNLCYRTTRCIIRLQPGVGILPLPVQNVYWKEEVDLTLCVSITSLLFSSQEVLQYDSTVSFGKVQYILLKILGSVCFNVPGTDVTTGFFIPKH